MSTPFILTGIERIASFLVWAACIAFIISAAATAEELSAETNPGVTVVHHRYSGLPCDPVWEVRDATAQLALKTLLDNLKSAESMSDEGYGLGSYTIQDTNGMITGIPGTIVSVDQTRVSMIFNGKKNRYTDPHLRVLTWIRQQTGKIHQEKPDADMCSLIRR